MRKKLIIVFPILIAAAGGAYKFVLAKPTQPTPVPKIAGTVYVLPKDFLVNLAGGRYLKLGVAVELEAAEGAEAKQEGHASSTPPEGFGSLPQEAVLRSLITEVLTGTDSREILSRDGRGRVKKRILEVIERDSDVDVRAVFFPDLAVQ